MTTAKHRLLQRIEASAPPSVRAALYMGATLRGEHHEARRILSHVSDVPMLCRDPEFLRACIALRETLTAWVLDHWQTLAQYHAALASTYLGPPEDDDGRERLACAWAYFRWRLVALDDALQAICEAAGISPDDVRDLFGIAPAPQDAEHNSSLSEELAGEYVAALTG